MGWNYYNYAGEAWLVGFRPGNPKSNPKLPFDSPGDFGKKISEKDIQAIPL